MAVIQSASFSSNDEFLMIPVIWNTWSFKSCNISLTDRNDICKWRNQWLDSADIPRLPSSFLFALDQIELDWKHVRSKTVVQILSFSLIYNLVYKISDILFSQRHVICNFLKFISVEFICQKVKRKKMLFLLHKYFCVRFFKFPSKKKSWAKWRREEKITIL